MLLVRQRTGTVSDIVFIAIEDEESQSDQTAPHFERFRRDACHATAILVQVTISWPFVQCISPIHPIPAVGDRSC